MCLALGWASVTGSGAGQAGVSPSPGGATPRAPVTASPSLGPSLPSIGPDEFAAEVCTAVDELIIAVGNPDTGTGSDLSRTFEAAIRSGDLPAVDATAATMQEHLERARTAAERARAFQPADAGMDHFLAFLAQVADGIEATRDAAPDGADAAFAAGQRAWDAAYEPWIAWLGELRPVWEEYAGGMPVPCPTPTPAAVSPAELDGLFPDASDVGAVLGLEIEATGIRDDMSQLWEGVEFAPGALVARRLQAYRWPAGGTDGTPESWAGVLIDIDLFGSPAEAAAYGAGRASALATGSGSDEPFVTDLVADQVAGVSWTSGEGFGGSTILVQDGPIVVIVSAAGTAIADLQVAAEAIAERILAIVRASR
jgi:hypothetical protein